MVALCNSILPANFKETKVNIMAHLYEPPQFLFCRFPMLWQNHCNLVCVSGFQMPIFPIYISHIMTNFFCLMNFSKITL